MMDAAALSISFHSSIHTHVCVYTTYMCMYLSILELSNGTDRQTDSERERKEKCTINDSIEPIYIFSSKESSRRVDILELSSGIASSHRLLTDRQTDRQYVPKR